MPPLPDASSWSTYVVSHSGSFSITLTEGSGCRVVSLLLFANFLFLSATATHKNCSFKPCIYMLWTHTHTTHKCMHTQHTHTCTRTHKYHANAHAHTHTHIHTHTLQITENPTKIPTLHVYANSIQHVTVWHKPSFFFCFFSSLSLAFWVLSRSFCEAVFFKRGFFSVNSKPKFLLYIKQDLPNITCSVLLLETFNL